MKPLKDHMTKVSGGEEPTWEELCKKSNGGGPGADQAGWAGYTPFTPDAVHVNLSASGIHQPNGRCGWLLASQQSFLSHVSSLVPSIRIALVPTTMAEFSCGSLCAYSCLPLQAINWSGLLLPDSEK